MKHTHEGSCTRTCGHVLATIKVKSNAETQRQLDRDPRVVEYSAVDDDWFEVVFAFCRPVAAIYHAAAAQLRIQELAERKRERIMARMGANV